MSILRCGLLSALVVGLVSGQGRASTTFTLDKDTALLLHQVSVSPGDVGLPFWVTDSLAVYGGPMQGTVGYVGLLFDSNGDLSASTRIGAAGTAALGSIQTAGSYTGFELFLANDDDDPWQVQLYIDAGSTSYFSGFTTLPSGAGSTLMLSFGTTIDFAQVTDIGFEIRGDFSGTSPSNPDFFHISAVPQPIPAPGALLLTLVGIGVIRLGRRNRG
jgi:hypothetical protein